jgi:hypothetical protein
MEIVSGLSYLGTLMSPRDTKNKLDNNIPICKNNHLNIYDRVQTNRVKKDYNKLAQKRFRQSLNPSKTGVIPKNMMDREKHSHKKHMHNSDDSEFSDSDFSVSEKSCSHDNTATSGLFLDRCNNCVDNNFHERQFVKKQKDNNNYASQFAPLVHDSQEPVSQNAVPKMNGPNSAIARMEAERFLASNTDGGYSNFAETGDMTYGIVKPEQFTHNNMQPNFKQRGAGLLRSEKAGDINQRKMELFIGANNRDDYKPKRESGQRFDPITNMKDQNGLPVMTDFYEGRYIPGTERRNERPFQPIKVTPGIGLGPNGIANFASGVGDTSRVLPRTTDEIRQANKPKLSYEGVVVQGQKGSHSAVIGKTVQKRAPLYRELGSTHELEKTFFETPAPRIVGKFDPNTLGSNNRGVKKTGRFGPGQHVATKNTINSMREKHKQTNKQSYLHAEPRNIQLVDSLKPNANYESFTPNITQRGQETKHYGGVNHSESRKSYTVDLVNITPEITKRNIHEENNRAGHVITGDLHKGQYFDPSNITKTTHRTVNNLFDRNGNTTGETQNKHYYDENDIAKQTQRTVNNLFDRSGNTTGETQNKHYYNENDIAKQTQRTVNNLFDRTGNTTGETLNKHYYNENDIAKLTQRTIKNKYDRAGVATTGDKQIGQYYNPSDITKITNRTVKNLFDRAGHTTGDKHRGQYYDPNDITKLTNRETTTGKIKHLQQAQHNINKTYIIDYVNAIPDITKREETGETTYIKPGKHIVDKNYIIDYANATPDVTKREEIGETTHINPAKYIIGKEHNRTGANNSQVNVTREKLAKGRKPTLVNYVRTPNGDLTSYTLKIPTQIEREHAPGKLIQSADRLSFTQANNKNPTYWKNDRINTYAEENLKHNPYINNMVHKAVYKNN